MKQEFYTLRTLVKKYDIEFRGNCRVFSNVENFGGTIYGADGYGLDNMEDIEKEMDKPYLIYNTDIGYFDLHNAEGWCEAYKRSGYEVEII